MIPVILAETFSADPSKAPLSAATARVRASGADPLPEQQPNILRGLNPAVKGKIRKFLTFS